MGLLSWLMGGPKVDMGDLIKNQKAQVIDVRSPGEYQSGHLKGSINIPLDQISKNASKIKKDRPVVVCCASGTRSGMAKGMLKQMGFEAHNGGSWTSLRQYMG